MVQFRGIRIPQFWLKQIPIYQELRLVDSHGKAKLSLLDWITQVMQEIEFTQFLPFPAPVQVSGHDDICKDA